MRSGKIHRSWIGLHARRIRLAYVKLSETAVVRFHRVYAAWISGHPHAAGVISSIDHQRSEVLQNTRGRGVNLPPTAGYLIFETDLDRAPRADLEPYITSVLPFNSFRRPLTSEGRFERAQHTGDIRTAVESLRAFFDQRFTKSRNPPRQHALNALAYLYYNSGEVESARQVRFQLPNRYLEASCR